jgi:DNA-binding LytR/AlgR family response regulator
LHYRTEPFGFAYHYEKDLIAYVIIATIFWLFAFREAAPTAGQEEGTPRTTFDIEDGRRVTRVDIKEIAAVRAAGNYVEFLLTDGRRPLMRGTLVELQASLGHSRFVRVHRSWLVNGDLVRELKPGRWGDFVVVLTGDVAAPLSRRFPNALERLRCRQPSGVS